MVIGSICTFRKMNKLNYLSICHVSCHDSRWQKKILFSIHFEMVMVGCVHEGAPWSSTSQIFEQSVFKRNFTPYRLQRTLTSFSGTSRTAVSRKVAQMGNRILDSKPFALMNMVNGDGILKIESCCRRCRCNFIRNLGWIYLFNKIVRRKPSMVSTTFNGAHSRTLHYATVWEGGKRIE